MERSDEQLLAAWRAGEPAAGQALFERHYEAVARFFYNKLGTRAGEDNRDLIQRTFLACVEGATRFRGDARFRSYLFAIAYRQLCRYFRDRAGRRVDFGTVSLHDLGPSPTQRLAALDEQRLLLEALRRIPFDCQVVLELHYWESMKTAEMAVVLEIPEGTVKSRLRRGRTSLREAMEALADAPGLAERTFGDLEGWAARVRQALADDRE